MREFKKPAQDLVSVGAGIWCSVHVAEVYALIDSTELQMMAATTGNYTCFQQMQYLFA